MSKSRIWLSSPHMGNEEQAFVKDAFEKNWIAPVGPHLTDFESQLSKISSNRYVAALSSGTSAIHLSLVILGVGPGDLVLCSSFTFAASANPIIYQGASPVFIDSEQDTWNMCPDKLEEAILHCLASGTKPKAIILVHLYGMSSKMNEIMNIAVKYDIPLIEDAAEALGSTYENQPLGTFGDFGVFSFNGNKIITTSGGGALISNNKKHIEKAKYLATQARDDAPHYEHSQIGYNYRMSNVLAAIGLGQLKVLFKRVEQRRHNFSYYRKQLSSHSNILFLEEPNNTYSNRWITTILTDSFSTRERIRCALMDDNIESRPLWKPMHLQPVYKNAKMIGGLVSETLFERGLCLPSASSLSQEDLERVINVIKENV